MTLPARSRAAAAAFDALGARYEDAYAALPEHHAALAWLVQRLPAGASVLDIGCGTGRPTAEVLAATGHDVLGIDVSPVMIDLARERVPAARFELADVRDFEPADFGHNRPLDAVCAFFPLLQMSRPEVDSTLRRAAGWLAPGGYLVLATVPVDVEDVPIEFMGQPVRATSYPTDAILARLRDAGLGVLHAEENVFTPDFPGMTPEPQLFCYAQRPIG